MAVSGWNERLEAAGGKRGGVKMLVVNVPRLQAWESTKFREAGVCFKSQTDMAECRRANDAGTGVPEEGATGSGTATGPDSLEGRDVTVRLNESGACGVERWMDVVSERVGGCVRGRKCSAAQIVYSTGWTGIIILGCPPFSRLPPALLPPFSRPDCQSSAVPTLWPR